ncbi:molybdenum transport ATP-binding protein [Bordetella pertussis]|nr:molybdenum transport ATP-binding protein [Bordetella pertussis]
MVVHARDVSLALQQPREGSILNVLAVRVAPEMQAWAQIKAVSLLA